MAQKVDLTALIEDELIALNRRVVERIRQLRRGRSLDKISRFSLGDGVSFEPDPGRIVSGTVIRLNQKTITVATGDGDRWRVAPEFLSKTTDAAVDEKRQKTLVSLVAGTKPRSQQ